MIWRERGEKKEKGKGTGGRLTLKGYDIAEIRGWSKERSQR